MSEKKLTIYQDLMIKKLRSLAKESEKRGWFEEAKINREKADQIERSSK